MTTPTNPTPSHSNGAKPAIDPAAAKAVSERYAVTVKARLAKQKIDVLEARDGMLDCFVATYHNGLSAGMKAMLDVDATPEDVARIAAAIFRRRLKNRNVPFEAPTIDALAAVKEEADREFHFEELPAEFRAIHDQVCALLLSKAEGTMGHHGDQSVLARPAAATTPAPGYAIAAPSPAPRSPSVASAPPRRPDSEPLVGGTSRSSVSAPLRRALDTYLRETADRSGKDPIVALRGRLHRALRLLESIEDFEQES